MKLIKIRLIRLTGIFYKLLLHRIKKTHYIKLPKVDLNRKYSNRKLNVDIKENPDKNSFSNTAISPRIRFNLSDEKFLNDTSVFDNVSDFIIVQNILIIMHNRNQNNANNLSFKIFRDSRNKSPLQKTTTKV